MQTLPEDLTTIGNIYDNPHWIALGLVILLTTASVEIWSARQEAHRSSQKPPTFLALLFLLPITILYAVILYLLPAVLIVTVIKYLAGETSWAAAEFERQIFDPTIKLALFACLIDNFSQILRYEQKLPPFAHSIYFAFYFPSTYYGAMMVSWGLARILAAGGGFAAEKVSAMRDLFSLPRLVQQPRLNEIILLILVCIGGLLAYWLSNLRRVPQLNSNAE